MRTLATLQERFGFTKPELVIIALLAGTFVVGMVLRRLEATNDPAAVPRFDTARADSIFASRSIQPFPSHSQNRPAGQPAAPKLRPGERQVNVNTASKEELILLPGIGPGLAERIIAYRREHGLFGSIDDLVEVGGIGEKTLERFRSLAVVE
jgi:comEA protein